jgi:heme oxygenase
MLYVLEGSRLGGSVLLRKIYAGAPNSFLSARHGPGEWREFLALIDQRAAQADGSWVEFATAGASTCFELYQQAASCIIPHMSYSKG